MNHETIRQVTADLTDRLYHISADIALQPQQPQKILLDRIRTIANLAAILSGEVSKSIPAAPAPAAEGEAEAIAIKLQQLAPQNPLGIADPTIARAAELLRQKAPAYAPSSERPWERDGWCDAEGRCWMGNPGGNGFSPTWRLAKVNNYQAADLWQLSGFSWSLPHWAIPTPPAIEPES